MTQLRLSRYVGDRPLYAVLREAQQEIPAHGQDFHELMHVVQGGGNHVVNGENLEIRAGQTWYIGPDDWHLIQPDKKGLTWINVAFHDPLWQAFKALTAIEDPSRVVEGRSSSPFEAVLDPRRTVNPHWALANFLLHALDFPRKLSPGPKWLHDAVACLDWPENLRLGVSALRDRACVSPSYLTRSIRAHYGLTPTDLVNKKRLEKAAHYLASGSTKIGDIAYQCGFESTSYFYRMFQREYGKTPMAFRRSNSMP